MSAGGNSEAAFRLDGKVALVTGATRGLGEAVARDFAAAGATLIVTGRDAAKAQAAAKTLGGNSAGYAYEAATMAGVEALAAAVKRDFGRLDVLVNNAAILKPHSVEKLTEDEFDQLFQVNVKSALFLTKALLPLLLRGRGPAVVNVTAAGGHVPMAGIGAYCASKAAVLNLTRTLAKEWTPRGIRVNALTPGSIATDMILPLDPVKREQFVKEMAAMNLMNRLSDPIECARAIRFLASDAASFITGQALIADGGFLA
jgi:NAD(P)-dependent dehydrogenase (short-subunit alcohol dehydrogenase family)